MSSPTLGQLLLGTEGLALLRDAFHEDAGRRDERVAEIRDLVARYDADLAAPLPVPEYGLTEGYERWSKTYDRPLRLFPIEEPTVHQLLQTLPPGMILDAACGTGRHSEWLAARGHKVIGVDRSEAMLAKARSKLPYERFEIGDLVQLPLPDASVDGAVCALALVHLPDLRPAFAEFARVIRPGGRLVVSDVHPFLVQLGWQAQFHATDGETGFMRLHRHLPSSYATSARAAGFDMISLHEPLITADAAMTAARDLLPAANAAAWVGLPGVIVWEMSKP